MDRIRRHFRPVGGSRDLLDPVNGQTLRCSDFEFIYARLAAGGEVVLKEIRAFAVALDDRGEETRRGPDRIVDWRMHSLQPAALTGTDIAAAINWLRPDSSLNGPLDPRTRGATPR